VKKINPLKKTRRSLEKKSELESTSDSDVGSMEKTQKPKPAQTPNSEGGGVMRGGTGGGLGSLAMLQSLSSPSPSLSSGDEDDEDLKTKSGLNFFSQH